MVGDAVRTHLHVICNHARRGKTQGIRGLLRPEEEEWLIQPGAAAVTEEMEVPEPGEPARLELACTKLEIGVLARPASHPPEASARRTSAQVPVSRGSRPCLRGCASSPEETQSCWKLVRGVGLAPWPQSGDGGAW